MRRLKNWLTRGAVPPPEPSSPDHPSCADQALTAPVYVIGDVHGTFDLVKKLEKAIAKDAGSNFEHTTLVYVGDLVDRGPDSASVLDHLSFKTRTGPKRICLYGNHEQMMLGFLAKPQGRSRWLAHGGVETLASYGIHADPHKGWDYSAKTWRYLLDAHIPSAHLEFLHALPRAARFGPYFISHSGLDPAKPLAEQSLQDLLWSRPFQGPAPEDVCAIHGHTVVDQPELSPHRINVDTGAYATGVLSAVCLAPNHEPRVLQTTL